MREANEAAANSFERYGQLNSASFCGSNNVFVVNMDEHMDAHENEALRECRSHSCESDAQDDMMINGRGPGDQYRGHSDGSYGTGSCWAVEHGSLVEDLAVSMESSVGCGDLDDVTVPRAVRCDSSGQDLGQTLSSGSFGGGVRSSAGVSVRAVSASVDIKKKHEHVHIETHDMKSGVQGDLFDALSAERIREGILNHDTELSVVLRRAWEAWRRSCVVRVECAKSSVEISADVSRVVLCESPGEISRERESEEPQSGALQLVHGQGKQGGGVSSKSNEANHLSAEVQRREGEVLQIDSVQRVMDNTMDDGVEDCRRLASCLLRAWRQKRLVQSTTRAAVVRSTTAGQTSIELSWRGAHEKKHGTLVSHVLYLQWVFRSVERLRPGAWARHTVPEWIWIVLRVCRRRRLTKCRMGKALAVQAEFDEQKQLASEMLDWYGQYVAILRRLSSGEAPRVFDDFCGGGAVGEGIRRGGGVPFGMDIEDQPSYKLRFAPENFWLGDGVDWSLVRRWQKKHRLRFAGASPPCKWYSTARQKGEARQPPLIGRTRDMLEALFDWWWIENVMGAKEALSEHAVEVDGLFFGLRVFRSRLFETNFHLHVDEVVRSPAVRLRARCCLGHRNRWRTFDEFGRPYLQSCCAGNVFVPIGEVPWRCTLTECADAMGLDVSQMPYDRLAQAVPPDYSQWVFGQMCMQIVKTEFGCPAITFDDMRANPSQSKRMLSHWLRGVGSDRPSAGMAWKPRLEVDSGEGENSEGSERAAGALLKLRPQQGSREVIGGCDPPQVPVRSLSVKFSPCPPTCCSDTCSIPSIVSAEDDVRCLAVERVPLLEESTFRELYYAHFGGFNSQWSNMGALPWLDVLNGGKSLDGSCIPEIGELIGKNTYLEASSEVRVEVARRAQEAVRQGGRGTRITLVTSREGSFDWAQFGFSPVTCETTYGEGDDLLRHGLKAAWIGRRAVPKGSSHLNHDLVREFMDVQDLDGFEDDKCAKSELTWTPISHDASLWRGKGMPADVESIMTEGVIIEMDADASCFEVPQYPYPDAQSLLESMIEADRALAVGHMEYVPDEMVSEVNEKHIVHPWLMVWQGKWRLCQDYSDGTNRAAFSAPFGLPSSWDARKVMKPGSYLSKYDLRDFFWSIPVHKDSRKRLVMRHPGTGRLMWCRALPFGYLDSPRQACRVSEALAGEMRRRAAGLGIHFLCYVDDYLIVGDNYELTQRGEKILEEVLAEFGMQWAPSKHRGPVQCLEFLGLLLCNVEGHRCIALTESRQRKLRKMIDDWMERRRTAGGVVKAPPVEIAKLLGHLVFASQVVPGGRTYMQNMLSVFEGLEIDWKHGRVRPKRGVWDLVALKEDFWIDLEWWSDHLESRNCVQMNEPQFCEAVVSGTDASDWGAGSVIWLDGHKEECNLAFTAAERRRPINFRELLGIVRVLEIYGKRLSGFKVMIETDNMAAKGAATKLASTASSMQEMLRRLYEVAGEYGIVVMVIHTPGAKLFRPDQTSRGDPIEEPRLRLKLDDFKLLERKYGPFTEFVGTERRYPQSGRGIESGPRLWLHPAHNTVGSALRLLGERLAGYDGDDSSHRGPPPTGVILVPFAPEAHWWSMTKHFACVGRWEAGDFHLEMNQLGSWKTVRALRPSIALVFPRSAGSLLVPVELPMGMTSFRQDGTRMGYVESADRQDRGWMLPLSTGSFVYSPGVRGGRGELLMVWHSFRPDVRGRELDEEGEVRVSCAELLLKVKKGVRSTEYAFDRRSQENGGSFANGGRHLAWELAVGLLWTVDHLVTVDSPLTESVPSGMAASPKYAAVDLEGRSFFFDFRRAEKEIKAAKARQGASPSCSDSGLELASIFNALDVTQADQEVTDAEIELAAARQSADEAAGLKKIVEKPARQERAKSSPVAPVIRGVARCRYAGQHCEGCNSLFIVGERIVAGCRAMVHPNDRCLSLAKEKLTTKVNIKDSTVAAARLSSLTDGERLVNARRCLEGKCCESTEAKVLCLKGCGRGVHLVACLNTSAHYAAAGRLICLACRLGEIMIEGELSKAPASLVQRVTLAMVAELTTGAVSTAAGRDQFASLERRWVSEMMADGADGTPLVKLPRHNIESFLAFMWWLVTDADRARSFATVLRAAGAVMSMLQLTDWTKLARVKAQMKDIEKRCGVESDPCTQTTRRIIRIMDLSTIKDVCFKGRNERMNKILDARTRALLVLELLAGLRVGEATSSGDLHGLEANNLCFLRPVSANFDDGLGETIEVKILDSKTGPGRHSAFVAKTVGPSQIAGGDMMRHWLNQSGIKLGLKIEGGFEVEHPNYWVVRVNLASFSTFRMTRFLAEVEATLCDVLIPQVAAIRKYTRERFEAKNLDAELKYVNVMGGSKLAPGVFENSIAFTVKWLEEKGYGRCVHIVPGPLIRATLGTVLTHMPLTTKSIYTHLIGAIKGAYEISKEMEEPDEELDLQGLPEPKFGNHSLRRHSDKS